MSNEPTYKELQQKVKDLESELTNYKTVVKEAELGKEYFQKVLDSITDSVIAVAMDRKIMLCNHAVEPMFGYAAEEILNHSSEMLYPNKQSFEYIEQTARRQIREQGYFKGETVCKRKDGSTFPVYASSALAVGNDNQPVGIVGVFRDLTDINNMKNEIARAEEKFRALFEYAPVALGLSDLKGRVFEGNQNMVKTTGYYPEDFNSMPVYEVHLDPEDSLYFIDTIMESGKVHDFETKLKRKDGAEITVLLNADSIEVGNEKFILTSIRDITEQKKIEQNLRYSQELYKKAEILGQFGHWERNIAMDSAKFSSGTYRIFGVDSNGYEHNFENFLDLVHPSDREMIKEETEACIQSCRSNQIEYRIVRPDGNVRTIKSFVEIGCDEQKNPVKIFGILQDITDRVLAEEAKTQSEAKFSSLLETMNEAFAIQDENGLITFVNSKLIEITGYSKNEIIGKPVVKFLNQVNRKTYNEKTKKRQKDSSTYELKVLNKRGRKTTMLVSGKPIFNKEGKFKGSFVVMTDISVLKKKEHELRKSEKELQIRTAEIEDANVALRVLLKKRDEDKNELKNRFLFSIKELIIPNLEKLKKTRLNAHQSSYLDIVESNLNEICSPMVRGISSNYLKLTSSELQVANYIINGKTTKEIADILHLSAKTIESHRKNIRTKIGIRNKSVNLRTYLISLTYSSEGSDNVQS